MNTHQFSIAAVERDTGLGKDTLRAWERRYGFPAPTRDAHGERLYPAEQVDRLRRVKRLMSMGMRPGKIFGASDSEWDAWLDAKSRPLVQTAAGTDETNLVDLVRLHSSEALRHGLRQTLLKQGLERFVIDTIGKLNVAVGEAWMRGDISVTEEHLYTEQVQNVLRSAIALRSESRQPPRILLTTLPGERHSLGLLMAEALLVMKGAQCVSIGMQTPLADIVDAVTDGHFDILALSFSSFFPHRHALASLESLAARLPQNVEIWAGGQGLGSRVRRSERIRIIQDIDHVPRTLQEWRAAAESAQPPASSAT